MYIHTLYNGVKTNINVSHNFNENNPADWPTIE